MSTKQKIYTTCPFTEVSHPSPNLGVAGLHLLIRTVSKAINLQMTQNAAGVCTLLCPSHLNCWKLHQPVVRPGNETTDSLWNRKLHFWLICSSQEAKRD